MTQQEELDSLQELEEELSAVLEDLEDTEKEVREVSEWTEIAREDLEKMSEHDRRVVSEQASELKGQLRILETPDEIIEFGGRVKESFSKPVEQSAIQGLENIITELDIELPEDRISELKESVRSRPPSDLQEYVQGYQDAVDLLKDEPIITSQLIASEVKNADGRYLIGPSQELTPLIEDIQRRRETLEELQEVFGEAGSWVPDGLLTISQEEAHYKDYNAEVPDEEIKAEVTAIEESASSIDLSIDIPSIIREDLESRLGGIPIPEYKSELNSVATKLDALSTNVQGTLDEVDKIMELSSIPDSLSSAEDDLESKLTDFRTGAYQSVSEVLGAASSVEKEYEGFLNEVVEELELLDTMCSQIMDAEESDLESPTVDEPLPEFRTTAVREHPKSAFETITVYRNWVEGAFEELSDQFEGEEVSTLFERLHKEDEVPLSSVDLDALHELEDTVPIVVSLQQ